MIESCFKSIKRRFEPQRRGGAEKILTASFAAKNAKSAKKSLLWILILRIFAFFAAENYFFSAPPRLCGKQIIQVSDVISP
jgi:hypothetical protein